ncbi:protein CrcB [Escherichia coli]|uniref:Protein CrcB n=1 Tax=Escherichia coli TaxID=562 RepID=A0A376KZV2_ECOLX|nr:protein CrcB [Escherichia coli]
MLQLLLAVFIGGGTGSVARWLLSMRFNPLHQAIPLGDAGSKPDWGIHHRNGIRMVQQDDEH